MRVELVTTPIDVAAALSDCTAPECGAVTLFLGVVRCRHEGHAVDYLDYEAYPALALKTMHAIASRAAERWPLPRRSPFLCSLHEREWH